MIHGFVFESNFLIFYFHSRWLLIDTCNFVDGIGKGGKRTKVGNFDSSEECAFYVRNYEPYANGASYKSTQNEISELRGECFAEFEATGKKSKKHYQTCLFTDSSKFQLD